MLNVIQSWMGQICMKMKYKQLKKGCVMKKFIKRIIRAIRLAVFSMKYKTVWIDEMTQETKRRKRGITF